MVSEELEERPSWRKPRLLQHLNAAINGNLWRITLNCFKPKNYYQRKDITPYLWPNGKILPRNKNYEPLPLVHGAPLRLRVEKQLGYKVVKWITLLNFWKPIKTWSKAREAKMKMINTLTYWLMLNCR